MKNKILNLSKYAYLDFLKGDIFTWLNCNENFQKASKEDEILKLSSPWRYNFENDPDYNEDESERYNIPDQIKVGIEVGELAKKWAINNFPNHNNFTINKRTNLENLEYTKQLLEQYDNVILFDATFGYNDFFIRSNILVKTKNEFKIIEVKSVTCPKIIHGIDIFFQKMIIEKGNNKNKNWDYSLLILNSDFINDVIYSDNEKANYIFENVNYILSTKAKPQITRDKIKYTWSINNNKFFFKNFSISELKTFDFDPEINSGPKSAASFLISNFFKTAFIDKLKRTFDLDLENIKRIQLQNIPPKLEFRKKNNSYMPSNYLSWAISKNGGYLDNKETVFDVARLNFAKKIELFNKNIVLLKDIPNSYLVPKKMNVTNENSTTNYIKDFYHLNINADNEYSKYSKLIQKHFTNLDQPLKKIDSLILSLKDYNDGPIYMYDFETANLAIPLTNGARPYEQVVYQFSIHIIKNAKDYDFKTMKNIEHREWLAKDVDSFSTEVWKEFIKVFNEFGPGKYVAWNMSFEKNCIKKAQADSLTDKEEIKLRQIGEETIDLMVPFQKKIYYHRNFHGSYSIKYVGPYFVKEIDYKKLNRVQKGDQSAAYAKQWLRKMNELKKRKQIGEDVSNEIIQTENEWLELRGDMLKYCEYDTLLMVAILQKLQEEIYND